ncbi:hypothetical protein BJX63DRAFT_135105 [Aspergillus granulosus]|uniref:Uncharacterized protein n=1 Tax=Aspergillus granulosus TaxID=176169 RepID=A0ABR4HMM9_9EURO
MQQPDGHRWPDFGLTLALSTLRASICTTWDEAKEECVTADGWADPAAQSDSIRPFRWDGSLRQMDQCQHSSPRLGRTRSTMQGYRISPPYFRIGCAVAHAASARSPRNKEILAQGW